MNKPIVWSITGSDCSGGAGIQADLQTIVGLGGYACSVVTAVTAQNSLDVNAVNLVSEETLLSQLNSLDEDIPAVVIKIGLLVNQAQVAMVAEKIGQYKDKWRQQPLVIYDPVILSTTGQMLIEQDIIDTVIEKLFPLVDVLTPNIQEVQTLTGIYLLGAEAVKQAAVKLMSLGVGAVVIKGGQWDYPNGYCVDYCGMHKGVGFSHYWLVNKTIRNPHTHGVGCAFSAAIATVLGLGYPLRDAFVIAKAYVNQGIKSAFRVGEGIGSVAHLGWPTKFEDFPQVVEFGSSIADALELDNPHNIPLTTGFNAYQPHIGLYPIVDCCEWVEKLLQLGVKIIQLRLKAQQYSMSAIEEHVRTAVQLAGRFQAKIFINDHWQLAIKYRADGVHLGQEDLQHADLKAIKSAGLCLGISTQGYYELLRAYQYQPSYVAISSIYPTKSKQIFSDVLGIDRLQKLVNLLPSTPIVAIGGITRERALEVVATGVAGIAVISAITEAENLEDAVRSLQSHFIE